MTKEEEKAITEVQKLRGANNRNSLGKSIETVLCMLKEKDTELEKKDKIIDEMAKYIEKLTVDLKIPIGENMLWNIEDIKQCFERKIENE